MTSTQMRDAIAKALGMNPADIQIVDIGVNDADQAVPAPSTWAQSQADKDLTRAVGAADEIEMLKHKVPHLEAMNKELTARNDRQTDTILKLQTQHENQRETILELQRAAGIRAKPSQREYLRHELMDRASTMSNIFEAMIIDHPAIDPDEDCFSTAVHNTLSDKINAAADALNDVYQFIGDKHL